MNPSRFDSLDAALASLPREVHPGRELWYVGDTVDDARSARGAGVPFVGIAAPASARREELVQLFHDEKAVAVLDDINQLEQVLS